MEMPTVPPKGVTAGGGGLDGGLEDQGGSHLCHLLWGLQPTGPTFPAVFLLWL